jgi:hypothetical protein
MKKKVMWVYVEEDIRVLSECVSVYEVSALVMSTLEVAQKGTYQGRRKYVLFYQLCCCQLFLWEDQVKIPIKLIQN